MNVLGIIIDFSLGTIFGYALPVLMRGAKNADEAMGKAFHGKANAKNQ